MIGKKGGRKMRETTCCFTGHRPSRLPWGNRERDPRCVALKAELARRVEALYHRGYRHFICGMALGCDLYFCEAVLALRERFPDLLVEAAVPCQEQADSWSSENRRRYQSLLERCDWESLIQKHYDHSCMHRRNRYMVDHASLVLAVYDGRGGGTCHTLSYALSRGVKTELIDLNQYEISR